MRSFASISDRSWIYSCASPHRAQSLDDAKGTPPLPLAPPAWRTDQLVEWVKPVRPPLVPPAWLTPEVFAALPAVLGA